MKISLITACWNSIATIGDAIESVRRQRLPEDVELEYLIVDGGSTDGTVELIQRRYGAVRESPSTESPSTDSATRTSPLRPLHFTFRLVSEPDKGLYDALNKGIRMSTGDVIGICNADDVLASDRIIAQIAQQFKESGKEIDVVYGDIRFVKDPAPGPVSGLDSLRAAKPTRYCTGRFFRRWMFRFATFPAHPSTFVRRECFETAGLYSLDYRICADFEFMLRLFWTHRARAKYLPLCTHVMRAGGLSTGGVRSNVEINREDLRALKANGHWSCLPLVYLKYPFKVFGILFCNFYMRLRAAR